MKVLIVGSGGREHAIALAVSRSPQVDKIYCAPGNAGIAELAECVDIKAMEFDKLVAFAKENEIDLTVVGMDDPLVGGIVDKFEEAGLRCFGPRKNAAIIEGSKAFSKDLMKKYNIPTAGYENFTDADEALKYLETAKYPIVLKADGLALGKGVLICENHEQAVAGVAEIMQDKKFGDAGNTMVIEEFMTGREVSVLSFVDGNTVKIMSSAQDHKRAGDGDTGLNTGGMGNFSPSPFFTKEVEEFCQKNIFQPTVDAMKAEGRDFKGVIFFGLMLTEEGPKVLEYNARFGDPEAQVVLPRLENDIIDVFNACIDGTLDKIDLRFSDEACVCVVLASDGYPVSYEKGYPITGFEKFNNKDYFCFHAGTAKNDKGEIVTNGGRVLGITALGKDLEEARERAYEATEWIQFDNKYMRHDIANSIIGWAKKPFSKIGLGFVSYLVIATIVQILLGLAITKAFPSDDYPSWVFWVATMVPMYCVALPISYLIFKRIPREDLVNTDPKFGPGKWLKFFTITVFAMSTGNIISSIISLIFRQFSVNTGVTVDTLTSETTIVGSIVLAMVGPIVEEFLFRKIIIDRTHIYGARVAIFTSALMFGLFHGNFAQFFYAFFMGLVWGYVYYKTGKLRYSISFHMVINFMGGVLAPVLARSVDTSDPIKMMASPAYIRLLVYSFLVIGIAIAGLVFFIIEVMHISIKPERLELPKKGRFKTVWCNVGMILFVVACVALFVSSIFKGMA